MDKILSGNIYKYGGIYYLILLEKDNTSKRKMYWCSINRNKDDLVNVTDFGLVTPNEEWQYVETLSNVQYAQALNNFVAQHAKHLYNGKTK